MKKGNKTDELLGRLGQQMRDFPAVTTFPGAKQAESAVKAAAVPPAASAAEAPAPVPIQSVALEKEIPAEKVTGKAVRNLSVTLYTEDIAILQKIRFRVMEETGKPTVSISETIRIALRAFGSDKTLPEISAEVEQLDGRGTWKK
ncbi:MAG: hypothetical protein JWM59_4076 [Verrucomicrobiales bacterium]|nr:hypothetical protein [Verrucomicrobiales bacterium]